MGAWALNQALLTSYSIVFELVELIDSRPRLVQHCSHFLRWRHSCARGSATSTFRSLSSEASVLAPANGFDLQPLRDALSFCRTSAFLGIIDTVSTFLRFSLHTGSVSLLERGISADFRSFKTFRILPSPILQHYRPFRVFLLHICYTLLVVRIVSSTAFHVPRDRDSIVDRCFNLYSNSPQD